MNIISGIDVTSGALTAQKTRLDIVAQNIANAQTTRGPDGLPYQRKTVSFETELLRRTGWEIRDRRDGQIEVLRGRGSN